LEGQNEPIPKSLEVRVAKSITKEFIEPLTDEKTWSEETSKDYEANARPNMHSLKH